MHMLVHVEYPDCSRHSVEQPVAYVECIPTPLNARMLCNRHDRLTDQIGSDLKVTRSGIGEMWSEMN